MQCKIVQSVQQADRARECAMAAAMLIIWVMGALILASSS